jgi:hypothetical protein
VNRAFQRWELDIYGQMIQVPDVTGMHQPARCTHCRTVYDLGTVTVEQRYADCSVWRCPGCKLAVDDRGETGWTSRRDYIRLDAQGREVRR